MQNDPQQIREAVRRAYAKIGAEDSDTVGCCAPSCCSPADAATQSTGMPDSASKIAERLGYSAEQTAAVPEGANLGLGCGNPQAIAALSPGETVLDLGSGGGFDCFLAARQVGDSGSVIGVDMTPEMIARARNNAEKMGADNVDFRLGEIEKLPVADATVDVIMSNCVINLSPDKSSVFHEAFRVLKPGGRLAISDIVATRELSDEIKADIALLAGCVSGAAQIDEVVAMLESAGFEQIEVQPKPGSREVIRDWFPQHADIADSITSATIQAVRPRD